MPIVLTEEQLKVIAHPPTAHGRVLAGPGTGKSTTAAALAEALSKRKDSPRPKFLTFTRAATAELAKKLPPDLVEHVERPSTIHSFAISVLLQNPGCAPITEPLRIPDDYEFGQIIRPHLAHQVGVSVLKLDELIAEMAAKWESLNPEERPRITSQERARFMGIWCSHRRVFGYTLLPELPDLLRCALRDNGDLKGVDYRVLIVDEYQDLNACDLELLKRIAARGTFILAVGDDDQSIYSFRKAHPAGIRRFLGEYQTQHDYKLTVCQRSSRRIIEWAQFVIQGDTGREVRNPPTFRTNAPDGITALLNFGGDLSEAKGVADLIVYLRDVRGVPASEILVLSRTDRYGTFTRLIKGELAKRGVPIADATAVEKMLADNSNRRLMAILRLLVHRGDSLAWWTLLSLYGRIGDAFIDYIFKLAQSANTTFGEALVAAAADDFKAGPSPSCGRAVALWNDISVLLNTVQIPDEESGIQWGKWIVGEVESKRLPDCSDELKQLLIELDDCAEADIALERFLSQVQLLGEEGMRAKSSGVRFMTMMGSKGLTVRATIVVGVDDDLVPRPGQDLAEEHRLLYVAMTRAQEFLFLTWVNRRRGPAARSGRPNTGRRRPSDFLRGGPVESQNGQAFVQSLLKTPQQGRTSALQPATQNP